MPPQGEPNEEAGAEAHEEPDFALSDDDYLIRKIPSIPHIVGTPGNRRISKSAFSASSPTVDPDEGMSTNVERLILKEGALEDFAPDFPEGRPHFGFVSLSLVWRWSSTPLL